VDTPCLILLSHHPRSVAWRHAIGSPCTVAVLGKWSAVLVLHCSRMSVHLTGIKCTAGVHVLQAHDGPDIRHLENMRTCVGTHASLAAQIEACGLAATVMCGAQRCGRHGN
jgi:hypothetical protein